MKKPATPAASHRGGASTLGRNGYRYRQQFGVVVICDNEQAQKSAFERLKKAGYARLRVVTV